MKIVAKRLFGVFIVLCMAIIQLSVISFADENSTTVSVSKQPQNCYGTEGTAKFSVTANSSNVTYRWQYKTASGTTWKDSTMTGSKSSAISVEITEKRDGQSYRCIISDGKTTVTSKAAYLYYGVKPSITSQPSDFYGASGNASFTVKATSGVSYRWQYKTTTSTTWKDCTTNGYNKATLSVPIEERRDGYKYRCIVTDGRTSATSKTATLHYYLQLKITSQPSDYSGFEGQTAIFSMKTNKPNVTYKWQYKTSTGTTWRDCTSTGYNTSALSVQVAKKRNGYSYRCRISDGKTTLTTKTVTLVVIAKDEPVSSCLYFYDQLNSVQKTVYNALYEAYKDDFDLSNNTDKSKIAYVEDDDRYYVDIPLSYSWLQMDAQSLTNEISSIFSNDVYPAYIALVYDHPEMCWISYTGVADTLRDGAYDLTWSYTTSKYDCKFNFVSVAIIDKGYSQGTASNINRSLYSIKSDLDSYLPSKASRYDKVKAIHDKISDIVSYENSNPPYNTGYQTIYSVFNDLDGDGIMETVCAGYAQVFKALCDLYGIPCVLVRGTGVTSTSSGAHMWNYVQMEDGKWYGVDVTWDDTNSSYYGTVYDYFLSGSTTLPGKKWYQITFEQSHISKNISSNFDFIYPTLNSIAYG